MNSETKDDFADVNKVKAMRIMQKIIIAEANALKAKGNESSSIVKTIQSLIEEEVQCY